MDCINMIRCLWLQYLKGTDCAILFIGVPALIIALLLDYRRNSIGTKLFLTAILALFAYYSTSVAFGLPTISYI